MIPRHFAVPLLDVEFVIPFVADADPRRDARNSVSFIVGAGRLREGISHAHAEDDLNAIARRLREQYPIENARKLGMTLVAALDGIVGPFRTALLVLFAAVGTVLVIACANLANLMLARATAQRKHIAVRLALGSPRSRLVQQQLTETCVLGLTGGALGLLLAQWGVEALMMLAPADLPRSDEIRIDGAVLAFSAAVSLGTGLLFGLAPAVIASTADVSQALQESGRGAESASRNLTRGLLVAAEVSLAFVLLIVAALFGKSYANVQAVTPGFEPQHALSARLSLPARRYTDRETIVVFQRQLEARLATVPGVQSTGAVSLLPLSGLLSRVPFTIEGQAIPRERVPSAQFRLVTPGYFDAMRIPVRRGRAFSERDSKDTRPVAVVSEMLVRQWFENADPLGAHLLVDDNDGPPRPIEIVGMVGDVQQVALDSDSTWDLYLPYSQIHRDTLGLATGNMFWVVRTASDPAAFAPALRREIRAVDPEIAAADIRPLDG